MKNPKKILITGSSGFVGSNLVNFAKKYGYEVYTMDLRRNDGIVGDLKTIDWKTTNLEEIDVVVHLAAKISINESINDPETYYDINVNATERLFKACLDSKVKKIIFASSAAVYGDSKRKIKIIGEEGKLISPYAENKLAGEYLAQKMGTENSRIISLRLFNIYGPGQIVKDSYSSVIPLFIERILDGHPINIYGSGEQTRDFIHIFDVCKTILSLIEFDIPSGEIINIGSGKGTSINKLTEIMIRVFSNENIEIPEINYKDKRDGDVDHSIADTKELEKYMDLEDFIDFENGLETLIISRVISGSVEL